jgi:hypothetical protein
MDQAGGKFLAVTKPTKKKKAAKNLRACATKRTCSAATKQDDL